jgi:hypothetical protein
MGPNNNSIYLAIYGLFFQVESSCDQLRERISLDFSLYLVANISSLEKIIHIQANLKEASKDQGNIFFDDGVVVNMNHKTKNAILYHQSLDRLHEITYLYLLSILGKALDQKGMHRIHASAIACGLNDDEAVLFVGKSGMGKSHLAYLLPYMTLSDDTPFLSLEGLHPMQTRRGFLSNHDIGEQDFYKLKRLKHGQKYLVPMTEVANKINYKLKAMYLLKEGTESSCRHASFFEALTYLGKYLFIGLGTPQIAKFFLEPGFKDHFVKVKIGYLRLKLLRKLLGHSRLYILSTNRSSQTTEFTKAHLESLP